MISEDKININYARFIDRLKKYDCYSQQMIDELGENIKNCTFAIHTSTNCAYKGALLDVVLNNLCAFAYEFNERLKATLPNMYVDPNSLMRVLLLQHISKVEMFVPQEQEWKIKNGFIYDFNPSLNTVMKLGERSLWYCLKYKINLTEEEFEAIRSIDKDDKTDNQHVNPLVFIVKMANQLISINKNLENNGNT